MIQLLLEHIAPGPTISHRKIANMNGSKKQLNKYLCEGISLKIKQQKVLVAQLFAALIVLSICSHV